jgi:hypothetical protein
MSLNIVPALNLNFRTGEDVEFRNNTVNNSFIKDINVCRIDYGYDLYNMTFNQTMDYLLKTSPHDQAPYILIVNNTNANNLFNCTYKISDRSVPGFHDPKDNFLDSPLDSEFYKGTLFYTDNDYALNSKFLTNCTAVINLYEWAVFLKSVKNTQYWTMIPMVDEPLEFPYTAGEINSATQINEIFSLMNTVDAWEEQTTLDLNTKMKYMGDEFNKIAVQDNKVGDARGERKGRYWSPARHFKYEYVDDIGLAYMDMYLQDQKSGLDKIRTDFSTIFLNMDAIVNAMDWVATGIASEFGLDKPMKFATLAVKTLELEFKMSYNTYVDNVYHHMDQETQDICSEKEYRYLVKCEAEKPHEPTPKEISTNNNNLDYQIKLLRKNRVLEHDRIFDVNAAENLIEHANSTIRFYNDQIREWNRFNENHEHDALINEAKNNRDILATLISNKDFVVKMCEMEKSLYSFYDADIDEQIVFLEKMKFKEA